MRRAIADIVSAGLLLLAGGVPVQAGTRAPTTVTISTKNGDFWGYVDSTRPLRCADGRKIVLYRQLGDVQDPKNDTKVASDTASAFKDRFRWETGNTGLYGRFYARAVPTPSCRAATSDTVRSRRT